MPRGEVGVDRVELDDGVHDLVTGDGDAVAGAGEVAVYLGPTLDPAEGPSAVPGRVLGEERGQPIRVIAVVTGRAVAGLELLDGLDVLQPPDPRFQLVAHRPAPDRSP